MAGHFRACAAALMSRKGGPPRANLDAALTRYTAEIETLRQAGELRRLASDDVRAIVRLRFQHWSGRRMNLGGPGSLR